MLNKKKYKDCYWCYKFHVVDFFKFWVEDVKDDKEDKDDNNICLILFFISLLFKL